MPFIAYKITHRESGKAYVGITTRTLAVRWKEHKKPSEKGRSTGIWRAINKHGKEAFFIEQLASANCIDDLLRLEAILIKQHATLAPRGYNLVAASDGIWQGSEETRRKLSALARNMSAATKAKISAAGRGQKRSAETCAKIGDVHRGRKCSPEAIEKIRAALLARPYASDEHRAKLSKAHLALNAAKRLAAAL